MKSHNLISIGKVVRTQGRRGELRLKLYIEHPPEPFFLKLFFKKEKDPAEYEVESLRQRKDSCIIKLKGIQTIAQAGELVGLEAFVPEEDLIPLEGDDFYLYQIIDCAVLTKEGGRIGTVTDVLSQQGNDLLVVAKGESEIYIPFTRSICLEVDLKKKEILIDPPEGLLDLNEI